MKRAVVSLNNSETLALKESFLLDRVANSPLEAKLSSAYEIAESREDDSLSIDIEISQDELETILDEIGLPGPNDTPELISLRKKLREMMMKMQTL